MNASQKEQLFGNLAEVMQSVLERLIARQLVHFYKADPEYGSGVAKKPGMDMERFVPWASLSLAELAEKTSQEGFAAVKVPQT